MTLNHSDILNLETRFRANLINSLGGFKSLTLIGTKHIGGTVNLATFSSLFHLGANPALCGIIIRPSLPNRNTLDNILTTKQYTVNHVLPSFYQKAHQCSAKYEAGVSEFDIVGFNEEYMEDILAPFVQESRVKFACDFVQKIDIQLNGTILIIGKIIKIIAPENCVLNDGFIDLEKAETVTCSGLDSYHTTHKLARLSYAVTNKPVEIIG
jgi:flavin reductase (DIM6/NTAB) family NADH-FMN oxidoreductase RutF